MIRTGLVYDTEWSCSINLFDKSPAVGFAEKADEITQIFTLADGQLPSVVHNVSVLNSNFYQTGTCKIGMVEFLRNSSFYE